MLEQKRKRTQFWGLGEPPAPCPQDIQAWKQVLINGILRSSLIFAVLVLGGGVYYALTVGILWLIPFYAILVGLWMLVTLIKALYAQPRLPSDDMIWLNDGRL